jgi:excisionase family DNA binding protein
MLQETPQLLTVREAADLLRQSEWSVRQKIARGEIPALRIGVGPRGALRIPRDELAAWLYADPAKETA